MKNNILLVINWISMQNDTKKSPWSIIFTENNHWQWGQKNLSFLWMTLVEQQYLRWVQWLHGNPFLMPSHWAHFVRSKRSLSRISFGVNCLQTQHSSSFPISTSSESASELSTMFFLLALFPFLLPDVPGSLLSPDGLTLFFGFFGGCSTACCTICSSTLSSVMQRPDTIALIVFLFLLPALFTSFSFSSFSLNSNFGSILSSLLSFSTSLSSISPDSGSPTNTSDGLKFAGEMTSLFNGWMPVFWKAAIRLSADIALLYTLHTSWQTLYLVMTPCDSRRKFCIPSYTCAALVRNTQHPRAATGG